MRSLGGTQYEIAATSTSPSPYCRPHAVELEHGDQVETEVDPSAGRKR